MTERSSSGPDLLGSLLDTGSADFRTHPSDDKTDNSPAAEFVKCSRRGCKNSATWQLGWNNPNVHTPDREKIWLACDEHRQYLEDFLTARSFLRWTRPFPEIETP